MRAAVIYLFLMVIWLAVAIALWFFPTAIGWKNPGPERGMLAVGATVLAVWNMVRAWSMYSAFQHRNRLRELQARPPTRSPGQPEKPVVHPEFNFDAPDEPPTANRPPR